MWNRILCVILGHQWGKAWLSLYSEYRIWHRTCARCNRHQGREVIS